MIKLALIFGLLVCTINAHSQTIKYVDQQHLSDVNVFFVTSKVDADAIVYISSYRSYSAKLGIWYEGGNYSRGIKVYRVNRVNKADVKIYLTKWRNEVIINEKYKEQFNITL